ncbi:hypothetical protein Ae201684P_010746 [Aphanomyces euteiches]|nr:hypothetical protein Ae201684P_010746 [Aphanomyces euteiches]
MDIGHIQDDMIRELMLFIAGAEFQSTFEAFFLKHALKFTDDEEHRLEYTQLFQEFQELFEQFMQQFYLKNNITEAEFGKRCRAVQIPPVPTSSLTRFCMLRPSRTTQKQVNTSKSCWRRWTIKHFIVS